MLKYEHIQPGQRIRAYDFEPMPGRTERYLEGEVIEHATRQGIKFLIVEVEKDTLHTNPPRRGALVPMETDGDDEWTCDRVVVIG